MDSMSEFNHTSGSTLRVGDAEIYYETQGDGPALLLLHGGVGTLTQFNPILPGFAGFQVLAIDSRGHGRSTLGSAPLTYAQLEQDVRAVLSHLGLRRLSLLGFSDGGTVASRIASCPGELEIDRLVLVGATWHNQHSKALERILSNVSGTIWRAKFPRDAEDYERWNPEPDFDKFVGAVVKMWMDQTTSGHPNETVDRITCPTLIARGDDDHLVSLEWSRQLQEKVAGSHLFNIPFAGHAAFADQPEVFLAGVSRFLRGGV